MTNSDNNNQDNNNIHNNSEEIITNNNNTTTTIINPDPEDFLRYSSEEEQENSSEDEINQEEQDEAPLLSHNTPGINNNTMNSNSGNIQGSKRKRFGGDGEDVGLVHKPPSKSQYLKSAMFGGMDGLTTVFVAVATVFGGNIDIKTVLIVGVAKLVSGALSMGVGDFLSSQAEVQHIKNERNREQWEFTTYPQGEKKEMVELYQEQGMSQEAAEEVVELMSRRGTAFVDVMMVQELGMEPYADPYGPYKNGIINFLAFLILGSVPLVAYIVLLALSAAGVTGKKPQQDKTIVFGIDVAVTVLTLILVGTIKSRFGDQRWYWSILLTVVVGILAAGSGYATAVAMSSLGFSED